MVEEEEGTHDEGLLEVEHDDGRDIVPVEDPCGRQLVEGVEAVTAEEEEDLQPDTVEVDAAHVQRV